ncbi:hypothetical protein EMCRGX_G034375 [Ephydatia muelleri]|eukprot:Em0023g308a
MRDASQTPFSELSTRFPVAVRVSTTPKHVGFEVSPAVSVTPAPVLATGNDMVPPVTPGLGTSSSADMLQATPIPANPSVGTPLFSAPSTPNRTPQHSAAKQKQQSVDVIAEYEKRKSSEKPSINLVVIGHVDAGKSTLMGHLLFQVGQVSKKEMHKYEQESSRIGKSSFAFAWVLDQTGEERKRGITMDIAHEQFDTDKYVVNLMDAPGHKDFIPNMITGAAQADVAILVVDATTGEFEAGFEDGGQTREHAILARSLGVREVVVAVNKMDMVDWCEARFTDIVQKLKVFLKGVGFKDADITYVPCSGLTGGNLIMPYTDEKLRSWYSGGTLLQSIDGFTPPTRAVDKPFRCCAVDVFKGQGAALNVAARIECGHLKVGDIIVVLPAGEEAVVKSLMVSDELRTWAVAGEQVVISVQGVDITKLNTGSVLCSPSEPVKSTTLIEARVIIFGIEKPITTGLPVILHYLSVSESAKVKTLVSLLNRTSGEVVKRKPRYLSKNCSAVIQVEVARPVCLECYQDCKELGRITLREGGNTIAAGLVTKIY